MKQQKILIVEDESTIREVIRKYLELEGFGIIEADSGTQALTLLSAQHVDLVVLDIMLPGVDGFNLMRTVRQNVNGALTINSTTPIIMLTSRGTENDRLQGFALGVDDYLVKPFSPRELVARVQAVLRRSAPAVQLSPEKPINFATINIDPARRIVQIGELLPALTAKEFDLLYFLAQHPQQVFSRTQLLDQVWGFEFYGDESTVTVHIRRLREKIERDPGNPQFVQTVWGVGYKFEYKFET